MKFLLADDHGLFRDSMAVWLKQYSANIDIIFAVDLDGLLEQLDNRIDLLLLDLGMPGMSGAASIQMIKSIEPDTPILVVSANHEKQTISTCLQAGASGYITKYSDGEEILDAVDRVLKGQNYSPKISYQSDTLQLTEALNRKQLELLSHLAEGASNKVIAEKMFLSEGTVKQYVSQVLRILQVENRTQAGNRAKLILGIKHD